MSKVVFYGWKIDKDIEDLTSRMTTALKTFITNSEITIEVEVIDVAAYGEIKHREGWGFAFGKAIKQVVDCNSQLIGMPDPELLIPNDTNKSYREAALESLKTVAQLLGKSLEDEVPTNVAVRKDGVSIGEEEADIIIPQGTLRYIEQIRDLLGGGAIEITKGDLKVEIKEKNNGES